MIFGLLYFCVVILCVNRSRKSFILYKIVMRHSRQSNVGRIWTCADNGFLGHRQKTCITLSDVHTLSINTTAVLVNSG